MRLDALRKRYDLEPVLPLAPPPVVEAPKPPEPTVFERIGRALALPKRYLIDLPANLDATEDLRERAQRFLKTGDEKDAPIPAGELMKEGFVGRPEPTDEPFVQHAKAVTRGVVGRVTDAATDPVNIGLLATGAGLAEAAPIVSKAMHVGFAGMMAKGTYDAGDAAYQEYRKDGWTPAVSEHATEAAIDAGFLTAVGMGLIRRPRAPEAPPTYEAGGALVPLPGTPPITPQPVPRVRGLLGEPIIDVEGVAIHPPERGLPPVPRAIAPGGPVRPPGGEEVPPQPPPPAPEPPPVPPPPAETPPKAKTPYEKPTIGKLSQGATSEAISVLDARIAEAEAKGLDLEVAELVRQRQALSEAYTVPQNPPPAPPPTPGLPEVLDEQTAVKQIIQLQQDALDARSAGDGATAALKDSTAESLRAQLKARRAAATAPAPPVTAPEPPVEALPPAAEAAAPVPGPRSGTTVEKAPEPALAPEPVQAAQMREEAARPKVQELLQRAETGAEPAPEEMGVIKGRPIRDLAKPPEAPLTAPSMGGTEVPEPVAPSPAPAVPEPTVERLAVPGPPGPGPVIELRKVPPEARPVLDYLSHIVSPDKVKRFEDEAAAALPPGTPWTVDTLEPLRGKVDDDVLSAAQTLLATGIPQPEPSPEEVAAKMHPAAPPPAAEEFTAPPEEGPLQQPLEPADVQALAGVIGPAIAEATGAPPTPEVIHAALGDMGVAVTPTEAQAISDAIAAPKEAPRAEAPAARPSEPVAPPEARPVLPEELPPLGGEAGRGPELPGVPAPAQGEVARGVRPAAPVGEPGVVPGAGAGGRRGVPEAGAPAGPAVPAGGVEHAPAPGGAEPGVPVEPNIALPAPDSAGEARELEVRAQAPAPAPQGALNNPMPEEVSLPEPTIEAPKDLSLHELARAGADVFGENRSISDKLDGNIAAIRILKDIEATGRRPTLEEQRTLAMFSGWGGMPEVFDPYRANYGERKRFETAAATVKSLMTEGEWEAATLSTPNAHYTGTPVVLGMWEALQELGLTPGQRVLEPAMGTGNFFTLAPVNLRKTGVELDAVTGRIARQLHPNAAIHLMGLEQTTLPDNFYDLVVGNPPFGKIKVFDPQYRSDAVATESIHNYMILKSLDKARPGGVVALITSRYTMDSKDPAIRNRILDRGDLIAAVRLPRTTFQKNANTQVVTDVLVFRKRAIGEARPATAPWIETKENPNASYYGEDDPEGRPVWRNAVWDTKVGKILGTETRARGMYGRDEYTVEGEPPTRSEIKNAILAGMKASGIDYKKADGQILKALTETAPGKVRERVPATPEQIKALKPGNFVVKDGKLFQAAGAELEEWEPPISKNPAYAETPADKTRREAALKNLQTKIGAFIPVRDSVKELLAAQVDPATTDEAFGTLQKKAEKLYDAFVKKHGFMHEQANDLGDDTDFPNVLALEKSYTPPVREGKGTKRRVIAAAKVEKADILKKRVAGIVARAEKAGSTREAYLISLGESGRLDWDRMAALTGKTPEQIQADAKAEGLVYTDPETRQIVQAEEYLSGNVRRKLKQAEAAVKEDPTLQPNVDALKVVLPTPKGPDQIHAPLGAGWVPGDHIKGFVEHLLAGERSWAAKRIEPMYLETIAAWQVPGLEDALGRGSTAGTSVWGQDYYTAAEGIDDILNLKTPQIYSVDQDGNRFLDVAKTENAKEIKSKLEQAWKEWLWSDKARADELATIFNDAFYGTVPRNYNGEHLSFPGMNHAILKNGTLYPFQKDAIWMMLQRPNTLVALPVGAGKTYTAIAAIMEARRMGTARKPVVLAPRAVLPQWINSFKQLYPSSQILYVDPEDMSPRSRGRLMSRIATGDYDAVIITHEGFKKLPLSKDTVDRMIGVELQNLERAFEDILRDKYADFAERSNEDVTAYTDAIVAFGEQRQIFERSPEYRADKKARFIPNQTGKAEDKPRLTLSEWSKLAYPKPPAVDVKSLKGESASTKRLVKQLAAAKLNLKAKVAKMIDPTRKDRNISFEQLGVDMMVVDEAHYYKRLFFTSKMERVPGLPTDFSERAYDLFMKMRVTQERNGGGGVHFLTGTPLTNTIAEMYSLFRYLDPKALEETGLEHFDAWAKTYATIATGIEVDPTGSSMRTATRFNQFVNLGSLLRAFRSFTYYKSTDELGIELPQHQLNENNERRPRNQIVPKSERVANYIKFLVTRGQRIKAGGKDITDDNPLLLTTDGMKAALDMRLIHPDYEDDPGSKLNQAVRGIFDRWRSGIQDKTTQLVFLDLGTPGKGTMRIWEREPNGQAIRKFDAPKLNLYEDMREKLVRLGVPRNEIEFIHDWSATGADPSRPMKLYNAVNEGAVRILMASSDKGGVGVNVQKRMRHLHHLDVPYTPDKLEQREGRIRRQGNINPEIEVVNWVTKGTFDIYKWQLVQQKASFISKALSGNLEADSVEDLGFTAMTAEEVIALGSDNPLVRDRLMTQKKLERIERLQQAWLDRRRKIGVSMGAKEAELIRNNELLATAEKDLKARTDELSFVPGIGEQGWKAYETYLEESAKSIALGAAKEAQERLVKWRADKAELISKEPITDRDKAAELAHEIANVMNLVSFTKVHEKTSTPELIGVWRGLPLTSSALGTRVGYAQLNVNLGAEPKNTMASLEHQTGKRALELWRDNVETQNKEARRAIETLKEQAAAKFEFEGEQAELQKQLYDVEEKLGLHKREQGTTQVEAQEEPGAGGGGEEPPEPPDNAEPYEDSPDPEDKGGDGPIDPPEGRPDQGAQPGENGWDRRVRNAKARTRQRGRGGVANMGVDPMAFWDAVTLGVDALLKGAQKFASWVAHVVSGLGANPGGGMLQRIWRAAQEWFKARTVPVGKRVRPVSRITGFEPTPGGRGKGPKIRPEEVRAAAEKAATEGPAPEWDRPGGTPDSDINLHTVRDEGGLRDLQAKMISELEKSLGRKARQVRSWAQVRAEAVLSGITEADFNRMLRKYGALTDMQITAGRILRQESAKAVRASLERWNELKRRIQTEPGANKELLEQEALDAQREYLANVAQYAAIAADTVAAGTEAGRALAAHRMMLESLTPEERFVKRLFRDIEPNEKQIAALTDALMRQDHARIMEVARQILKPGFFDMVREYYINSILSALSTPAANVSGNTLFMGMLGFEREAAARLEQVGIRQFIEKILTGEAAPIERVPGEGKAFAKALWQTKFGLWRGLVESWNALKSESAYSQLKGEYHAHAIPGVVGKAVRAPGRMLEAQDLAAKWSVKAAEKAAQILRAATEEGKRRGWNAEKTEQRMVELENELNRYIDLEEARKAGVKLEHGDMDYLVRNRTGLGRMYNEMQRVANEATFRDEVMQITKYVLMARHSYPWLTYLVPFIKTPERILVQAFRRTPVGLAKTLYNIKEGRISGGVASERLAAGMIGSLVSAGLYMLASDGIITGGGPADPEERKNWLKTGKQPYAVKVGNTWISLQRIEPLATTLGFAADLAEAKNEKTAGDVWDKLHYSVINNIANKTYLQSLIGAAEAFGDPERYGARLEKQMVGAIVPNLLAAAARSIDPTIRQTDDIKSTIIARIPMLSKTLPARLTGTGEPLVRGEDPLSRFLSPFRYSPEAGPEANLERLFLQTGYNPAAPPKFLAVGGKKITLTDTERQTYAAYAARATAFARNLAQNRDWSGLDDLQKEDVLRRIYRFAHDAAHREIFGSMLRRIRSGQYQEKEKS